MTTSTGRSKILDPAREHQSMLPRLVLCLLIGCLFTHFLVEKVRLMPGAPTAQPTAAESSPASPEDCEDPDDLAALSLLPLLNADRVSQAILAWIAPLQKQAVSPLLQPPQI